MTNKKNFDQDGFVHLPSFLTNLQLVELQKAVERYILEKVPQLKQSEVLEGLCSLKPFQIIPALETFSSITSDGQYPSPHGRMAVRLIAEQPNGMTNTGSLDQSRS